MHVDRWFSDGHATALVRDGEVEGHDDPPTDAPAPTVLVESDDAPARTNGSDLRRADVLESVDQSVTKADFLGADAGSNFVDPSNAVDQPSRNY